MTHLSRWAQRRIEADLMELRLRARHEGGQLHREQVQFWLDESPDLTEAAVRGAFAEGLADRASGVRCMCKRCELDHARIIRHEEMRGDYGRKRADELRAAGMNEFEIRRRIEIEIANGAALRGATHD